MNSNLSTRGVTVVCVAVKSRPMFPELASFEEEVVRSSNKLASVLLKSGSAACSKFFSSLPQFELFVFVAMMFLATA